MIIPGCAFVRDTGAVVAGRQGGRREINECYSKKEGNITWRPKEGHLTPEVKAANEIT
jgi:hypothetical protein